MISQCTSPTTVLCERYVDLHRDQENTICIYLNQPVSTQVSVTTYKYVMVRGTRFLYRYLLPFLPVCETNPLIRPWPSSSHFCEESIFNDYRVSDHDDDSDVHDVNTARISLLKVKQFAWIVHSCM